jgi:serine/threonine protein kinase
VSGFRDLLSRAVEGTYEIERELGTGKTAVVYLARSTKHDRHVAIKVLRPEMAAVVDGARFLREIEIAAKLTHPHILPLLDSNETNGLLYLVTPYIEGESLRERLNRDGRLNAAEAIRLITEVAGALQYAHAHGIVHRDIKPENILLQDGRAIVADFGISLTVGAVKKKRLTESGVVIGTPWYMSPEQVSGDSRIDARSDLYGLACVLYELLVGEPPFSGDNPQVVLVRQLSEEAVPLRRHLPAASPELEAALAKALSKDPNERFATAREFAQALERPLATARSRQLSPISRFRQWQWFVTAAIVLLATAGYAISAHSPLREQDWLVVADFEGPARDPGLTAAFRELVTAELNRSHFVKTLSRQQLNVALRDAGLAESTTVNSDLARELAFRSAVRGVVSGSIRETAANRYNLNVRVTDADRGNEILSLDNIADADNLMSAFASLAGKLRGELGEKHSAIEADRPLLDIATPSLRAYRSYVDAIALKQRGDIAASNRALRQALVHDTAFASAWALLGLNYVEQRDLDSARIAFAEALRRPSRLSDTNRYRLLADAAYAIDYDLDAAVRWYELYLQLYPHSTGGRNNYGLYLSFLGRREDALAAFVRAAGENPLGPGNVQSMLLNETAELITLGRRDRAQAVARDLTGPFATYAQIQLANALGNVTLAEKLAASPPIRPATVGWLRVEVLTTRAAVKAARGRLAEADHRLEQASAATSGAEHRWYESLRMLLAFVSHAPRMHRISTAASDSAPGQLVTRGLAAFIARDTIALRRNLLLLRSRPRVDSARLGQSIPVLQGLLDGSGKRWPAVISRLSPLARHGENDATNLDRLPAVWSRWLVADAYAHQGRPDSAIAYFRLAIADTGIASGHLVVRTLVAPFAHRELAHEYALRGDHDAAVVEWRALLEAMTNPDDAGAKVAREARSALAQLH